MRKLGLKLIIPETSPEHTTFAEFGKNTVTPELKTLEWDILYPDRFISLEINNKEQALFNLEIKKKRISSINLDIYHSKVFGSDRLIPRHFQFES